MQISFPPIPTHNSLHIRRWIPWTEPFKEYGQMMPDYQNTLCFYLKLCAKDSLGYELLGQSWRCTDICMHCTCNIPCGSGAPAACGQVFLPCYESTACLHCVSAAAQSLAVLVAILDNAHNTTRRATHLIYLLIRATSSWTEQIQSDTGAVWRIASLQTCADSRIMKNPSISCEHLFQELLSLVEGNFI